MNLNENFSKWFSGSKVVDSYGKPLVVYHGTGEYDFHIFKGTELAGWFSVDVDLADTYSSLWDNKQHIIPVFLSIQNPYVIVGDMNDFIDDGFTSRYSLVNNSEYVEKLKSQGFDGIQVNQNGIVTYAAFYPNQIKSAIGNNGNYDINDDDITK